MATDFESMVTGLPADEDAATDQLLADLDAEGSLIGNQSPFSPFFRLLAAIFTGPVLYLRGLITGTILPGLFAQTATGALLDVHAANMDETRKPASKAVGILTFTREQTTGDLGIPAGTIVESSPISGVVYRLLTTAPATILDGTSVITAPAEAEQAGAAYNLGDGYYNTLPVGIGGVTQVSNAGGWLTTPGTDIESDTQLRERLRLKWRRQSGWHTADTYRSLISDVIGIDPDDVYFDLTAPRGPGSADAYILTDSGIPSAPLVQQADDHINVDGNHGLGDDLQVKAMPALQVAIDVQITAADEATAADKTQLQLDIETLIRAAFRESTAHPTVPRVAPFERVSRSALAGEIHAAFDLVEAVDWTAPAADPEPTLALPVIHRATLDAGPAVDKGGGLVGLPATGHGFTAGQRVEITLTDNYDGIVTVDAATTVDELVFTAAFAAETLAGTEIAEGLIVEVA